jgi:RNA recognition motif-containing protein
MKLYVGNLSYDTNEAELNELFTPFGEVESARIPTDPGSSRSRGFGFVEMPSAEQGQAAIEALNGREVRGRALVVNEARPRGDRPDGGSRGGGFRGEGGRGPGGGHGPGGGRGGYGGGRDSSGGGGRSRY